MKYIDKVSEEYIYQYENPKTGKAELWDFSKANSCEEARIEAITTVASISYGNEKAKDPEKLYSLLIERGHESVFEFIRCGKIIFRTLRDANLSCNTNIDSMHLNNIATFKLKVPIFVARQIMRHRSFSYMEMSRRYVKGDKTEFEYWHLPNIKQTGNWYKLRAELRYDYDFLVKYRNYKPEQARAFLPLGLYTQFWMHGDYRAFANFFIQRLSPEAQEETRLVAENMFRLLINYQPKFIKTIKEYLLYGWVSEGNICFRPARKKKADWLIKHIETYKSTIGEQ